MSGVVFHLHDHPIQAHRRYRAACRCRSGGEFRRNQFLEYHDDSTLCLFQTASNLVVLAGLDKVRPAGCLTARTIRLRIIQIFS